MTAARYSRTRWRGAIYGALLVLLLGSLAAACMGGDGETATDEAVHTSEPDLPPAAASATATATLAATAEPEGFASATPAPDPEPTATASLQPTNTPVSAEPAAEPSPTPADGESPVIVLNPAHDPDAPGALGIEYREVLTTALYTKAALEEAGYAVYLTRYNNDTILHEDPTLVPPNAADFHPGYTRAYAYASKALQYDPDLVIVLHYNGLDDPNVGGLEVYYCENGGEQNLVLAGIVLEELIAAFRSLGYEPPRARVLEDITVARGNRHFPSLGNVYDYPRIYLENRYDGIPVVLTEPLYLSNPVERALIEDPGSHIAFADAYVRAVNRYFGR